MVSNVLYYGEMLCDMFPHNEVPGGAPLDIATGLRKPCADVSFLAGAGMIRSTRKDSGLKQLTRW